ncbi:MAG: SDR family NAD(P)-dependent oxidoreductase [Rhodospirillales bacterium]|nr:SDR family NAD(P)-dependent oxidoreductase [Rhodospirillales bacterium]
MMSRADVREVILVVGAGEGRGGAVATRFARGGYTAVVTRRKLDRLTGLVERLRSEDLAVHPFALDPRIEDEVVTLFADVERDIGPLAVVVFNIGPNVQYPIVETTSRVYRKIWELATYAGFLTGREAARHMVPRRSGSIFFTGATASLRGGSGFAAFAGAKFALRALAQSMARELGPQGIHVAHSVIDGPIDTAFIREHRRDLLETRPLKSNLLDPNDIAEAYWSVHKQPRSAWSFEFDLRPWAEPW